MSEGEVDEAEVAAPSFFLDSHEAMQSRVSWRRVWCLRTCQQGTKTVKISMTKMERAILGVLVDVSRVMCHRYVPLGRDEDGVNWGHGRDIEGDEPHGSGGETSNAAGDGLKLPTVSVLDAAGSPENDRGNDPGPEELPEEGWPPDLLARVKLDVKRIDIPFPASTLLNGNLHGGIPIHLGPRNAKAGMELPRDHEHQHNHEQLHSSAPSTHPSSPSSEHSPEPPSPT